MTRPWKPPPSPAWSASAARTAGDGRNPYRTGPGQHLPAGALPAGSGDESQPFRRSQRRTRPLWSRRDSTLSESPVGSISRSLRSVGGRSAAAARRGQRAQSLNARLSNTQLAQCCHLSEADGLFLENALTALGLSVRAWHRLLKVARTLADLAGEAHISRIHLAEALSYRCIDRLLHELWQQRE